MRFNEILSRSEGAEIASEIRGLRTAAPLVAYGVSQHNGSHTQFRFQLDEEGQRWLIEYEGGETASFHGGVLQAFDGTVSGRAFPSDLPAEVQMALPETMLSWGRRAESFSPMLAQHVGAHSLLLTFEHIEDPAFRNTLVVDERDGIARRTITLGGGTFITDVLPLRSFGQLPRPEFEPITDWIRTDY